MIVEALNHETMRATAKRPAFHRGARSAAVCAVADVYRTAMHRQVRVKRQVDVDVNRACEKRQHAERESHQEAEEIKTCESHKAPRERTCRSALRECSRCAAGSSRRDVMSPGSGIGRRGLCLQVGRWRLTARLRR